jgi:hypothetical protein
MAWFFEIRDSNNVVAETGKGFATHNAAIAAGRKRARELRFVAGWRSWDRGNRTRFRSADSVSRVGESNRKTIRLKQTSASR